MAQCRNQLKVHLGVLGAAVLVGLGGGLLMAQEPVATPAALTTPTPKKNAWRGNPAATPGPELENIRKALEALTPEQRQQFKQNFARWMSLPPEEKKALRDQNEARRKQMADEIDEALKQTGLQLDPVRQKTFARRYTIERRRVEEQLRQETQAKRGPLVAAIIEKLKADFSAPTAEVQ